VAEPEVLVHAVHILGDHADVGCGMVEVGQDQMTFTEGAAGLHKQLVGLGPQLRRVAVEDLAPDLQRRPQQGAGVDVPDLPDGVVPGDGALGNRGERG
jgi:hypothetical protein